MKLMKLTSKVLNGEIKGNIDYFFIFFYENFIFFFNSTKMKEKSFKKISRFSKVISIKILQDVNIIQMFVESF